MKNRPVVSAYYFPNWHVDPRNESIHGKGWTEWRVTQYATPRFEGHDQPKRPLYGFDDEADPQVMSRKIGDASRHGIDAFIFDYYWFEDGPYRERCLDDGFLKAPNRDKLKFALMWANHNPIYSHPGSYLHPADPLWGDIGKTTPETFVRCIDHCIRNYFIQPNYLRVDGGIYFAIHQPSRLVRNLGGVHAARLLLDDFRARVAAAGLGKLVLDSNLQCWDNWEDSDALNREIREAGFDMVSSYNWIGLDGPARKDYSEWFGRNRTFAQDTTRRLQVPFNPVVALGWDCSPRTVQSDMFERIGYPFGTVILNNTPEEFEKALRHVAQFAASGQSNARIMHLSCWNEWTEGAYLEPDEANGYKKLEAVKKVVNEVFG